MAAYKPAKVWRVRAPFAEAQELFRNNARGLPERKHVAEKVIGMCYCAVRSRAPTACRTCSVDQKCWVRLVTMILAWPVTDASSFCR